MEFLWSFDLTNGCLFVQAWHPMAQILELKPAADSKPFRQYHGLILVLPAVAETSFWPEVSSRLSSERPHKVDPGNAFSRVLFEIACVLAAGGALVAAISLFVQAPAIH